MSWFGNRTSSSFPWVQLTGSLQLNALLEQSDETPVVFFKHSTRCSISSMALRRFEQQWDPDFDGAICVYLDLLAHRPLSQELADKTNVFHQSPQVIVVKNNQVIYDASHENIDAETIISILHSS